jgi:hypothetical protein
VTGTDERELIAALEARERRPEAADFEEAMRLAQAVVGRGRAGAGERAAEATASWLAARPSAKRLVIASGALAVFWDRANREGPARPQAILALIEARRALADAVVDGEAELGYVLALRQAIGSDPPDRRAVAAALREAAGRELAPPFGELVRRAVATVLAGVGES